MDHAHSPIERLAHHVSRAVDAQVRASARWRVLDGMSRVADARRGAVAAVQRRLNEPVMFRAAILHPGFVVSPATCRDGTREEHAGHGMINGGTISARR